MSVVLLDPNKKIVLDVVDSTNLYLKNPELKPGTWVTADSQTKGKGRKNRTWIDIGDEKIIFSGKVQFNNLNLPFTLIPIFVAKAILLAIFKFFPHLEDSLKIKWPNDIYLNNRKISGVLVESEVGSNKFVSIIGIGLNISGKQLPIEIESQGGGYLLEKEVPGIREKLLGEIVGSINNVLLAITEPEIIKEEMDWIYQRLLMKDKFIRFGDKQTLKKGKVIGLTEQGFLLVVSEDESLHELMDTTDYFELLG